MVDAVALLKDAIPRIEDSLDWMFDRSLEASLAGSDVTLPRTLDSTLDSMPLTIPENGPKSSSGGAEMAAPLGATLLGAALTSLCVPSLLYGNLIGRPARPPATGAPMGLAGL